MRFLLYIFTWSVIVQTIGDLANGDIDQFMAGLFLSGLFVWWSVAVRNRRLRKLNGGILPPLNIKPKWTKKSNPISTETLAQSSDKTRERMETQGDEVVEVADEAIEKMLDGAAEGLISDSISEPENGPQVELKDPQPTSGHSSTEVSSGILVSDVVSPDPQSASVEEEPVAPERPIWLDRNGKPLNVGSKVSFLANSRGQSVKIPGVLLGEREGKAFIEVSSGALLPKNDYSIPWNVVCLEE